MIDSLRPYDGKELGSYELVDNKKYAWRFKIGYIYFQPETTDLKTRAPAYLWLRSIKVEEQRNGNGTKLLRHVCWLSLNSEKDKGRVKLQATESSHFFYLKTGFVPKERKVSLQSYTTTEISILNSLKKTIPLLKESLEKGVHLDKLVEMEINNLKLQLSISYEKYEDVDEMSHEQLLEEEPFLRKYFSKSILQKLKPELYPKDHEITVEELLSEQSFINGLLENPNHGISYIQFDFVPKVLACMKFLADHIQPGYTVVLDTSNFGQIDMELSPEGIERWKEDIEGKKRFVPFRRFEPLQKRMTEQQVAKFHEFVALIQQNNPSYFGDP